MVLSKTESSTLTLEEALEQSLLGQAYAWTPEGFIFSNQDKKPRYGCGRAATPDKTVKWRPVGKKK